MYPPSRPRQATGGIRARTQRGSFAENWWGKRWIDTLEGFELGARLARGRTYARKGQVLDVNVAPGKVTARVQGSRTRPYKVELKMKQLTKAEWKHVGQAISAQVGLVAQLLAGDMPPDIEDAFNEAGLSLFPAKHSDLTTDCSCPDWSNPCKHIAAVYYLLGEEFDRDPFMIFLLRGLAREDLRDQLVGGAAGGSAGGTAGGLGSADPEPLPVDPKHFWGDTAAESASTSALPRHIPPIAAALLKGLGDFPFWRGEKRLLDSLEPIYRDVSKALQADADN